MLDLGFQKLFLALPDESELPPAITITPSSDENLHLKWKYRMKSTCNYVKEKGFVCSFY